MFILLLLVSYVGVFGTELEHSYVARVDGPTFLVQFDRDVKIGELPVSRSLNFTFPGLDKLVSLKHLPRSFELLYTVGLADPNITKHILDGPPDTHVRR
jgi:hypothetical protein